MNVTDVLIIGQGLAGSVLAWRLMERGVSCIVVDRGGVDDQGRPSASSVAAGLLTPITGKRFTLDPAWLSMRAAAVDFYRRVEQQTGVSLLHEAPALRLFQSAAERASYEQRLAESSYAEQTATLGRYELPNRLRTTHGGFWMPGAARLDIARFLEATRQHLVQLQAYVQAELLPEEDFDLTSEGVVIPKAQVRAKRVALCQGYTRTPLVAALRDKIVPVKGELLRVASPALTGAGVAHRGIWLASPLSGPHDEFSVGATYEPGCDEATPTAAGRDRLLAYLDSLVDRPIDVRSHTAAIRPATRDRAPIVGIDPADPRVAWLNGLGAKGSLQAPWYAEQLASELASSLAAQR